MSGERLQFWPMLTNIRFAVAVTGTLRDMNLVPVDQVGVEVSLSQFSTRDLELLPPNSGSPARAWSLPVMSGPLRAWLRSGFRSVLKQGSRFTLPIQASPAAWCKTGEPHQIRTREVTYLEPH